MMCMADDRANDDTPLLRLAAGGFRDMTRIAAGNPQIWLDICQENQLAIRYLLNFIERLEEKDNFRGPKSVERLWYEWCYNWSSKFTLIKHAINATPPNLDGQRNAVAYGSFLQRTTNDSHFD